MKTFSFILCFGAIIALTTPGFAQKEKTIVISDSLNSRAEKISFKISAAGAYAFKFGDYNVSNTKTGWATSTEKSAIFNRKTEASSSQKKYFEVSCSTADLAHVNTVDKIESKALREWTLLSYTSGHSNFSIGNDAELLMEENSYSAFIIINDDTTDVWSLIMTTFRGTEVNESHKPVALLSNGVRRIYLVPVTSNDRGDDKRKYPACGYELRESGEALAALQFYGGGIWGVNQNIFWLPRDVDPKMKLVLAATLTAVLKHKIGHMGF